MKLKICLFCFLAFALPLFAFSQAESPIDDRAKFLSEKERSSFTAYVDELYDKTHFSLYLYTASSEVRDPKPMADSLLNAGLEHDSLRAVIFVDGSSHYRYLSISPAAQKFISNATAERLAQKYLLPEFRKDRYGQGIIVFGAELAKNVARLNDVRLQSRLPRPTKDGLPGIAWFLILAVVATVIIAFAYFVRQSHRAARREQIRKFGGFPHQKFDSGFGG
ncbi:MAG: TPM domain-containing protein [Fibrobacter sp.]|nr:TPM domain-containing protein [Fibrobacter sp.]